MSAVFSSPGRPSLPRLKAGRIGSHPFALRTALLLGSIAAGLAAGELANSATAAQIEPELIVLLRGMALIKASITFAALGLAFWRFGLPVSFPVAAGYLAGLGCLAAATVFIWDLRFILAAATIFHVGLFGLLLLAWREDSAAWSSRVPFGVAFDRKCARNCARLVSPALGCRAIS